MTIYKPTAEEQKVLAKLTAVGAEFKPLHKKLGEIFTAASLIEVHAGPNSSFGSRHHD
jgi:hypothetical protein